MTREFWKISLSIPIIGSSEELVRSSSDITLEIVVRRPSDEGRQKIIFKYKVVGSSKVSVGSPFDEADRLVWRSSDTEDPSDDEI